MKAINFKGKTFSLLDNSKNGTASEHTVFKYDQEGDLVTADYFGGSVRYGKIIAKLEDNTLQMLYQCITVENELKAGKASAKISVVENNKLLLKLNWAWLNGKKEKGTSHYIEN
ncbi:hypothetical protein [Spongiimicrobium sp. 3-5]|uniref:hypothetical protein n=1 Tax=Spongiimicrobium sp. 3-5 TaxID=3332596 RepID=UPI0039808DB9